MKCNTDTLFKFIDNTLSDEEELIFEEHINHCETCRETYNTFKLLEVLEEEDDISIDFSSKVMENIDKNKYSKKNYWYLNKFLINKKNIYKFAAVAMIAIMFTAGILNNKYIGLFMKGINTANTTKQGNLSPAANNSSKEGELGERIILSKDMVKAANINLILYDYKFTESDRVNSQEINKEIDKIEERTIWVTLKPYTPNLDLDSPIFKINIEYEKVKYEYYGYEAKGFKEKTIILQKYTGNINKDKEFYLLEEEHNIIQDLMNKFAANEKK
ncbi:anti-sigma factor family protein [Clostridium sp. UBA4548]|uniref:anti-sigma factor family protein n=1 Tax=Clostridium sp. UBA4548 TaxID=1946361 RepID=UPI0025C5F40A|nr:zf-HC2 domain-containing protein [Clostridium sp. UBA4548]